MASLCGNVSFNSMARRRPPTASLGLHRYAAGMGRSLMQAVIAFVFAGVSTVCSAGGDDLFVGVFESETRQNFGSDTPGEWRIEVVASSTGKYVATIYRSDKLLGKRELVACSEDKEGYLRTRPPGRAKVLCSDGGGFLSYVENGVYIPAVKRKYIENPDLMKQDGIKPGDSSLFEMRHHQARYYAHAQWAFYAFRKVRP